jgi:hypothetical protein
VAILPILEKPVGKVSDIPFGAYSRTATSPYPAPAPSGDKHSAEGMTNWFRDYGVTTTDPVDMKLTWSPSFAKHYENRKWSETYKGRLMLRVAGRFVVGSAAYSVAQLIGGKAFADYKGEKPEKNAHPLQWIAYGLDQTLGKAVFCVVYALTGSKDKAQQSIMFRNTREFGTTDWAGKTIKGRKFGQEIVEVTWDFAFMSFWNYMTGYVLSLFDKNNKTKWKDKSGKLDVVGGIKETSVAVFKGVTYAAGEDMFVAPLYVNYMKLQSGIINKFSPGFQYDDDYNRFGASFKVNETGKVIGDYNLEGVIGLTGRFSIYNVGTKMFRDGYAWIEERLLEWKRGDTKAHLQSDDGHHKKLTVVSAIKKSLKYTVITFTKVMFLMIPSAFLFGVLRTPQYKDQGLLIHPDGAPKDQMVGSIADILPHARVDDRFTNTMYSNPKDAPLHSRIANPLGKMAYNYGNVLNTGIEKIFGKEMPFGKTAEFTKRWAMAAVSYFPYFGLKSDLFAPYIDTNRTQFMLDGFFTAMAQTAKALVSFDGAKIKLAARKVNEWWDEVCPAMIKQPSPRYEAEIQRVMNDENYKASSEGYILEQDRFINQKIRHEEQRAGHNTDAATQIKKEESPRKTYTESLRNKAGGSQGKHMVYN